MKEVQGKFQMIMMIKEFMKQIKNKKRHHRIKKRTAKLMLIRLHQKGISQNRLITKIF